jgi:(2Fe-2S) ferredoxin
LGYIVNADAMGKDIKVPEKVVYVCNGPKCRKKGGKELRKYFKHLFKDEDAIKVIKTGCTDNCKNAPIVCIQPDNNWFGKVDTTLARGIGNSLCKMEEIEHESKPEQKDTHEDIP